jgi:hypothetical protein
MPKNEGASITEMDATDLIGRLVINPNGAEFVVERLAFDAGLASVVIWIRGVDDNEEPPAAESGVLGLAGWSIHQKIK